MAATLLWLPRRLRSAYTLSDQAEPYASFDARLRARVNMRSVHTAGSVQSQRSRTSPPCLAVAGTAVGVGSVGAVHHASIFLRPFAPPALPGFLATTDALTPVRRAKAVLNRTGLTDSCTKPSQRPVSNHPVSRPSLFTMPSSVHAVGFHDLPSIRRLAPGFVVVVWVLPLGCRLAAITRPNRVRFSTGRWFTSGCSPPPSRGRSYLQLQT